MKRLDKKTEERIRRALGASEVRTLPADSYQGPLGLLWLQGMLRDRRNSSSGKVTNKQLPK